MENSTAVIPAKINSVKKFVLSGVGLVVILVVGVVLWLILGFSVYRSPYLMEITGSVYSFSGRIDQASSNNIVVSNQVFVNDAKTGQVKQIKKISYNVGLSNKTLISGVGGTTVKASDLKVGMHVNVTSAADLRTAGRQFTATMVTIAPLAMNFSGAISEVKNGLIVVKAVQPSQTLATSNGPQVIMGQQKEQSYQVSVDANTQITQGNTKLSLGDLKNGQQVSVFTNQDVGSTLQVTAVRIDVGGSAASEPTINASPVTAPGGVASASATKATPAPAAPQVSGQNGPPVVIQ